MRPVRESMLAYMRCQPVIAIRRAQPFDDPAWAFELKLDGFRCVADTADGGNFPASSATA